MAVLEIIKTDQHVNIVEIGHIKLIKLKCFELMVYLLIDNENKNQGMRMNDVFICLNERWNENQSNGIYLKLKMITRVYILMGESGNENSIP